MAAGLSSERSFVKAILKKWGAGIGGSRYLIRHDRSRLLPIFNDSAMDSTEPQSPAGVGLLYNVNQPYW